MISPSVFDLVGQAALFFPVYLMAFTARGAMRGLVAHWMGDSTAYEEGFVTLNPLKHVDILSLLLMSIAFVLIGLIAPGSATDSIACMLLVIFSGVHLVQPVPINEDNFRRYRLGGILTSLGGALGCLMLSVAVMAGLRLLYSVRLPVYVLKTFSSLLGLTLEIATFFMFLELIPLPPFAGRRLLFYVLPHSQQGTLLRLDEYANYIFLAIIFAPGARELFFGPIIVGSSFVHKMLFYLFFKMF